jgi:hypothetical protein
MRKKLKVKLLKCFNQEVDYSQLLLNGAILKWGQHMNTEAVKIYNTHGQLKCKLCEQSTLYDS